MITALFDLGAASTPIFLVPAQDILKLLRTQPWSFRKLEKEELVLLEEAANFLESVKRGQSIIRKSIEDDTFVPDIVSLDAYEYTRRALERSLPYRYKSFDEVEKFIMQVYDAIHEILSVDNPDEGEKLKDLTEGPRRFFEIFIDYFYDRNLDIPHDKNH